MKKIKRDGIPPVEKENERDEEYNGANKNIDHSRTGNNIRFVERGQSYISYINQRIKELGCRTKKDTVLISSMLVSASPEWFRGMPPELVREYFAMCYRFFAERYCEENIVGAVVHLDETTPHMHLNLLPVLNGRFCCKHLFDRKALTKLQTDIYEQVGKYWGLERGKEGSKTKRLDVAEYKVKMAEEKAAEITSACAEAEQGLAKVKAEKRNTEQEVESLSTQKEALVKEVDDLSEVKDAATCPIPVVGKTSVITSLRVENARLKQENAEQGKEIERLRKDQESVFKLYQEEKKNNDTDTRAKSTLIAMQQANPTLYAELLRQAQQAQQPQRKPNFNSNNSGKR